MCSELASQSVDETLGLTFTWHLEESANVRCPEPNHKNVSPLAFQKKKKPGRVTLQNWIWDLLNQTPRTFQ